MNNITLNGIVESEPKFSHEVYGEKFFEFELTVSRQSGYFDTLIVVASETLLSEETTPGCMVKVVGEIRTYNIHKEGRNKLRVYVFARDILLPDVVNAENHVDLDGYICKPPVYRKTPLGREICDVLIACNRPYGKSDYIPTIAWGRNARRVGAMEVGTHIRIEGRMQSREYVKESEDGSMITKVAYELSVSRLEEVGEEEC